MASYYNIGVAVLSRMHLRAFGEFARRKALLLLLCVGGISHATELTYTYDALGRLKTAAGYPAGSRVNYNYDAAGNRTQVAPENSNTPLTVALNPTSINTSSTIVETLFSVNAMPAGGTGIYTYQWVLSSATLVDARIVSGGASAAVTVGVRPTRLCDYGVANYALTVTDSGGAKVSASVSVRIFATRGAGLPCR